MCMDIYKNMVNFLASWATKIYWLVKFFKLSLKNLLRMYIFYNRVINSWKVFAYVYIALYNWHSYTST